MLSGGKPQPSETIVPTPAAYAPYEFFPKYYIYGYCDPWPSRQEMGRILQAYGLEVVVGDWSVKVTIDGRHFDFKVYGGDIGDPEVDADDYDLQRLLADAARVSQALVAADVSHRFEAREKGDGDLVGCVHYRMPEALDWY